MVLSQGPSSKAVPLLLLSCSYLRPFHRRGWSYPLMFSVLLSSTYSSTESHPEEPQELEDPTLISVKVESPSVDNQQRYSFSLLSED